MVCVPTAPAVVVQSVHPSRNIGRQGTHACTHARTNQLVHHIRLGGVAWLGGVAHVLRGMEVPAGRQRRARRSRVSDTVPAFVGPCTTSGTLRT